MQRGEAAKGALVDEPRRLDVDVVDDDIAEHARGALDLDHRAVLKQDAQAINDFNNIIVKNMSFSP